MSTERDSSSLVERLEAEAAWFDERHTLTSPLEGLVVPLLREAAAALREREAHDCEAWQTEGLCCAWCNPAAMQRGPLPEMDYFADATLPPPPTP